MKKLLILCSFAAFFAACDTEKGDETPKTNNFSGRLTVTSNHPGSTAQPYTASNIIYQFSAENDKTFNLTMQEIKFAEGMPKPLTIVIPALQFEDADKDGTATITSTINPIVPWIGGKPFDSFHILNFEGTTTGHTIRISFTCKNPRIPVGGETLDHTAVYEGTILK